MDPWQSVEHFDLDTEPTDTLHESQVYAVRKAVLYPAQRAAIRSSVYSNFFGERDVAHLGRRNRIVCLLFKCLKTDRDSHNQFRNCMRDTMDPC